MRRHPSGTTPDLFRVPVQLYVPGMGTSIEPKCIVRVPVADLADLEVHMPPWDSRAERVRAGYQAGDRLPPIKVCIFSNGARALKSGNRRLGLARQLGVQEIDVAYFEFPFPLGGISYARMMVPDGPKPPRNPDP